MNDGKKIDNLRKAQLLELELLKKFREICAKEGFRYYLLGGTVLGAVRHKGFIPWDDDIDVALLREDYDRFISCAHKYLRDNEIIQHYSVDESYAPYPMKLVNTNAKFVMERENCRIEQNIWIDIFPIDGTPSSGFLRKLHYRKLDYYRMLLAVHYIKNIRKDEDRSVPKQIAVNIAKRLPFSELINPTGIKAKIDVEFRKYPVTKSEMIGNYMGAYHEKELFPAYYFGEGVDIEFENDYFKCPKETEKYLLQQYGDYMQLPPVERQVPKHNIIDIIYVE